MIETHTICRNSADFIKPVLTQVRPFVDKMRVAVAKDSSDGTIDILKSMPGIELEYYDLEEPRFDLVKARNSLLEKRECEWIWVLDDDEFYPTDVIERIIPQLDKEAVRLPYWLPVDTEHYSPSWSCKYTARFFRNRKEMKWDGTFGREHIKFKLAKKIEEKYIHFSFLKKHSWRKDFAWQKKYPFNPGIGEYPRLPENIIKIIKEVYEM